VKIGISAINKFYRISAINGIIGFIEILSPINFSLLSNSAATGEQKARDRSLQVGKTFTMDASFSNGDQQGCLV
jgi:hypothetical protein